MTRHCNGEDYPTYYPFFYFSYCHYAHKTCQFYGFTISCGTQLTFASIAFLNLLPLGLLLFVEVKIQQQIGWRRPTKFTALILMMISQFIVFVHYFCTFENTNFFNIMVDLQQFVIGMVFLALCYLFCKNSSKILPGRKQWLKIIYVVGAIMLAANIFISVTQIFSHDSTRFTDCKTWFYVEMQSA